MLQKDIILFFRFQQRPVHIVQLDLSHIIAVVPLKKFTQVVRLRMGGKAQIADATLFFLLQQEFQISGIFVHNERQRHLAHTMEKIEIKVFDPATL